MSAADATTPESARELTVFRRWMIMLAITSSTTLYAMTILIVSVVLPSSTSVHGRHLCPLGEPRIWVWVKPYHLEEHPKGGHVYTALLAEMVITEYLCISPSLERTNENDRNPGLTPCVATPGRP